jgi:hypothetical protein
MSNVSSEQLICELHDGFAKVKNELGLKCSFNELDSVFFIEDAILQIGFVSKNALSRQICGRIVETFMGWNHYLHNLIMPGSQDMIQMNESKMLNETDRKMAGKMIGNAMRFVSENMLNGLTKDKKAESEFIDGALDFWNEDYKGSLIAFMQKIHSGWKK